MCCLGYMCTKGRCLQHGWFQPQTQDIDVLATCFELARRCLPDTADASLYTGLVQVSPACPYRQHHIHVLPPRRQLSL